MLTTPIEFAATLSDKLEAGDLIVPLSAVDEANLLQGIPNTDDFTYLVIRDLVGAEVVKVTNTCSGLVYERGQDGTVASTFPKGSCIRWEMVPEVVKDLICTYDCCELPCTCDPVASAGITLPDATVGTPWNGTAIFSGDLPITLAASGLPAWISETVGPNYLALSGTPTVAGTYTIAVSGTNCGGDLVIQQATLTVTV